MVVPRWANLHEVPSDSRLVYRLRCRCRPALDSTVREAEGAAMPRANEHAAPHRPAIEWSAGVRAHPGERVDESVASYDGDPHAFDSDTDRLSVNELVHAAHGVPGVVGHRRHLGVDAGPFHEHEMATEVAARGHRTEACDAEQRAADVVTATTRPPRRNFERERHDVRGHVHDPETSRAPVCVVPVGDPG